jgi:hypothetical protein
MPSFPFTFAYAGRTFSVVCYPSPDHPTPGTGTVPPSEPVVFVRIIGTRGLHEVGAVAVDETNAQLAHRISEWYDETYPRDGRPAGAQVRAVAP